MAGEGQLLDRREDPDPGVTGGRVRRRVDEDRLAEADLPRQVLAHRLGHLRPDGKHRQLVPSERPIREHIEQHRPHRATVGGNGLTRGLE
jgi:hypothetical protein